MARTEIPVYSINRVTYNPGPGTDGTPAFGMFFEENGGYTFLEIENPGSLAITVGAVVTEDSVDDIPIPNKEIVVEPGTTLKFGPFPKTFYSQDDLSVSIDIGSEDGTQPFIPLKIWAFDGSGS